MKTSAFLTDSTLCIGCKACEVACKEWNDVPPDFAEWRGLSYDNTQSLGARTWRHVKFVEGLTEIGKGGNDPSVMSWGFSSDVCKHCEVAGCLEACPTGALVRTEFESVYLQSDVCNGCGYCVVSCPFGVVAKDTDDGRAFKCTFCYDRQKADLMPACAKVCPTQSIQFGELDELRERAQRRLEELHSRGVNDASIYDPVDSSVAGTHAIFIVRGEQRAYNLPAQPEVPTTYLRSAWTSAAVAAGAMLVGTFIVFLGAGDRKL
jgi:formate dehydrogenase iron-sulfur subunit